jgi:hypothetical protein
MKYPNCRFAEIWLMLIYYEIKNTIRLLKSIAKVMLKNWASIAFPFFKKAKRQSQLHV